ncbi:MAG: peptidoglycan DD-metalloendopeptidase family protein, partial [Oscillospiraceae bacterium]|nr:peptidoglycan DD-metalloendopeptidase family protein [Oscillospiraceae bacterium]
SALIASLEEDIEAYKLAFEENAELEDEVQAQIDKLTKQLQDEEAARKAAELAAQAKPNTKPSGGSSAAGTNATGYYYWPTQSSTYITSCFGYRVHPIFGTTKYHAGVDVAANSGATISAAAAGTVSIAEYNSSYGNYVVIYHPNGTTSLYAHMSQMTVSAGQSVSKGQTIGYVGSTGWSTGPHLHFEIRVNGSCVDPLQYYSIGFSYSATA